ncbi:hypothetical protein [Paractinoplanes rishiriensis]|nr:hypothetical protein [Actinoplanes rishiriensis]
MTSEGHYAGTQPAEATSGGPTSDGFPPDSDGQRVSGRASAPPPADGFPSSYAPPPPNTPNGGSPFVVPAVRTFGSGSDSAASQPAGTSYGSARVPQPDDQSAQLPQRQAASPYGSVSPGNPGSPYGSVAPAAGNNFASPFAPTAGAGDAPSPPFVPASGNAPEPPSSAWAPQTAPGAAEGADNPIPLPQRTPSTVDPATIGEFDGFAAGTPGRGSVGAQSGAQSGAQPDPGTGRPPGLSAFGDQRVRVPGATLTDLPDAAGRSDNGRSGDSGGFPARGPGDDRNADSGGFPLRTGGSATFPTRRGDSGGGFPLRGNGEPTGTGFAAAARPEIPGQPGDLPIRSQQPPYAAPTAGSPFSAFGPPPSEQQQSEPHPYARPDAAPAADPFGRRPDAAPPADPFGRRPDAESDPFGRPAAAASSFGAARPDDATFGAARPASPAAAYGTARPESPRSESALPESAHPDSTRPDSARPDSARPDESAFGATAMPASPAPVYGSARPGADQPTGTAYGSARPASPAAAPAEATYGTARPEPASPAPTYGTARPGDNAAFGSPQPTYGTARPRVDAEDAPQPASPTAYGSAKPATPFADGDPAAFDGAPKSPSSGTPYGNVSDADSPFAQRPASGSPFGAAPEPTSAPNPFSGPATFGDAADSAPSDSPFGQRPASGSPFGGAADPAPDSPFAQRPSFGAAPEPASSGNPFGSAQEPASGSPYGSAPEPAPDHPFGQRPPYGGAPESAPDSPFGQRPASGSPFGSPEQPSTGSPFGSAPGSAPDSPFGQRPAPASPFGGPAEPDSPFGSTPPRASSPSPFGDSPEPASPAGDEHALYRRPEAPGSESEFPQRVPGAALGSGGETRGGAVPQPRDPAEPGGAVGSARPVTASASVPSASRVAPVDPGELPPPAAAPQARVYGRPAEPAAEPSDDVDQQHEASPFDNRTDSDRRPFGDGPDAGRPAPTGFGSPAYPQNPNVPDVAPQSPARASARASASARVAPPAPDQQPGSAPPFPPFGSPPPPGTGMKPEHYGEMTTDIAGRGQDHQFPPPPEGEMRMGGLFPGPASRATVTPPSPDDTTNWPGTGDQNRFDNFKPEATPAKPETPNVKMFPILIAVVIGAVVLLGSAIGIVYLVSGDGDETFSVSTGECVKREGNAAVKSDCSDAASFEVVSIVDDKANCADPGQPYVINPTSDGKNQVLCLKPKA